VKVKIVAEIGINASGSVAHAIDLMRVASVAGCDAVKLQKRDLDVAIPPSMADQPRGTPWGTMSYRAYKERMEFDGLAYLGLARAAKDLGLEFSASAFDPPSVAFVASMEPPWLKLPSAAITDHETIDAAAATGIPLVLSTGGATWGEIDAAVARVDASRLTLLHCCSVYPHTPAQARLRLIPELRQRYGCAVGYSGHEEPGSHEVTLGAVAMGATFVERHITLSRHQWGSDQRASLEPAELAELVRQIRRLSEALTIGGERPVDDAEREKIQTMRRSAWAVKGGE
jgi:N-acetylneuraminate synthase